MSILVINPGSETTKFEVFGDDLVSKISGKVFKNEEKYFIKLQSEEKEITAEEFDNPADLISKSIQENIEKIGFRIVHGGDKYFEPTLLTDEVIDKLEKLNELAPLHNPPAIKSIKQFKKIFENTPFFGVFDTSFHKTIPEKAFLYGLPYEYYENYKIRKYGFHGVSVKYVIEQLHRLEPGNSKIIVCHLGGGSSITAIENGESIDTSMGFTPSEGVMMATRAGSLDSNIAFYLTKSLGISIEHIVDIENTKSGLLGISDLSAGMKELLIAEKEGNKRASLAIEMYIYQIQKQIGAYIAALGDIDALVFTGGIGEGSDVIRDKICKKLEFANIRVDPDKNSGKIDVSENLNISTESSKSVWVIPTNEELQIAKEIQ